jgi:archaellum biogenesis ATPase FlaH
MSTDNIREYNEDQQHLLISVLLSSEEIFSRCQNILNSKYFVNKLRPAVRFILKHAEDYRVLPKFEQVNAVTGLKFSPITDITAQHQDAFLDEIEEFCKNRALADAVLSAVDLIEKGNYAEVEKRVREAILISLQSDIGTPYFDDPRARLLRIKDNNGQVSTGWKAVDDKLYGGVNRGEITIWCAGSGVGKSLFLQNIAINFAKQGLNVIYISLELSEELCSMRMDSMISGIATKEVFRKIDEVEIKVKQAGNKSGSMHVKQMPQGSTCNDIKAYLKNYEIETGQKPDVLVVDYLDLLFPNNKRIDPSNLFVKDKFVTEELRGLCVERKIIGQTAAQLNRCLSLDTTVISNGNSIKIKDVNVGDWLDSNEGPVQVIEKTPIIKQPLFKITTKSGKTVTCSAKHTFPTKDGLKSLEDGLKVGDMMFSIINTTATQENSNDTDDNGEQIYKTI